MKHDFLHIIETRRSIRSYKSQQITDEELNEILKAGTYAPTSRGMQAPFIVAVQNEELKSKLAAMNASVMGVTSNPYYDAPTYILVFAPADANNPVPGRKLHSGKYDAGCTCYGYRNLLDSP